MLDPLLGGILIGLSASLMIWGLGRITGISGIFSSIIAKPKGEHIWRYGFIGGLLVGGYACLLLLPEKFNYTIDSSPMVTIAAGFIVGFGTLLGSGCTSGHGVCGISRLSPRSLLATVTFILFGIITVALKGVFS